MQTVFEGIRDGRLHTWAQYGLVPMIDVGDVAAVAAAALTEDGHERRTYRLTGPEAITYDEVAQRLSAVTGREVTPRQGLAGRPRHGDHRRGRAGVAGARPAAQHGEFAAGWDGEVSGDVEAVTGRAPRSLDACARDHFTADIARTLTGPEGRDAVSQVPGCSLR